MLGLSAPCGAWEVQKKRAKPHGPPALPADPCGACEGRSRTRVHLHLVSSDNTDPTVMNVFFGASGDKLRDQLHEKHCPGCKLVQLIALSHESLRAALADAAAACQEVKLLTVISHGAPGEVVLGPVGAPGLIASELADHIPASLSCAMAPDAVVRFDGCNVSRGCRGESFVTLLAARLLAKGGRIEACDIPNVATGLTATLCAVPHSLHVDAGPANPRWDGPRPKTGDECRANISRDLALVDKLVAEKGACNAQDALGARWAHILLDPALDNETKLGADRTQFTALQAEEASALAEGYSGLDLALKTLKADPACAPASAACGGTRPAKPTEGPVERLQALLAGLRKKL
jgi:hypothetical protein